MPENNQDNIQNPVEIQPTEQDQANAQPIMVDDAVLAQQPNLTTPKLSDWNNKTIEINGNIYTFNSANNNWFSYLKIKGMLLDNVQVDTNGKPLTASYSILLNNMELMKLEASKMFWVLPDNIDWSTISIEQAQTLIEPIEKSNFLAPMLAI